ncbi:MAG: HAD family hydrolase [Alphaproteobacteria bacterium]|jgi:phosphoglycolate phosphatase|nr:HAD family hydrolase [Alphaproteobacteria bacterium]
MADIRGLLFDKDGTLLDYAASWAPINRQAARLAAAGDLVLTERLLIAAGVDPATDLAAADSLLAAGNTAEIATAWAEGGSPYDAERLTRDLDALFHSAATSVVPVTDLAALFRRYKARGLKLGIASSDNAASIAATARHFGIDGMLDFIAGYDSGHGVKPEPGMVAAFCRATGLPPAEVAMIGDNTHDLAMGRAAGAGLTIGVLTGTGSRATLSPLADLCLGSILEIEAALWGSEDVDAHMRSGEDRA